MEACLLHLFFTRARSACLRRVSAACVRGAPVPLSDLAAQLATDAQEVEELAEHHGLALEEIQDEARASSMGTCIFASRTRLLTPTACAPAGVSEAARGDFHRARHGLPAAPLAPGAGQRAG